MSTSMSSFHPIEPLNAPSYDFMGSLRRIGHVFSTESNKPDEPSSACHSISSNLSSTSKFALPKPKPLPENIEPQSPIGIPFFSLSFFFTFHLSILLSYFSIYNYIRSDGFKRYQFS